LYENLFKRVSLELVVADYDRIGSSDPIGRVELGYNRKGNNTRFISIDNISSSDHIGRVKLGYNRKGNNTRFISIDSISSSDPIGRVELGYNRKGNNTRFISIDRINRKVNNMNKLVKFVFVCRNES
jgi:hypothetical protein